MSELAFECEDLSYDLDGFELFGGMSFNVKIGQSGLLLSEPQLRSRRLLQICATLRRPVSGRIKWFGRSHDRLGEIQTLDLRRRLGYVHRESRLVSNMSLLDNIVLGILYHRNLTPKEAEDQVADLLNQFGLYEFRHRRPAEVGYPMQRRAVYLRELTKKPRLFLLEVPALDLEQDFGAMMALIMESVKRREAALLLSDLTPENAIHLVDWVMILKDDGIQIRSSTGAGREQNDRSLSEPPLVGETDR